MKTKIKEISIVVVLLALVSLCFATWDNTKPADSDAWNDAAGYIRDNWDAIEAVFGTDLDGTGTTTPWFDVVGFYDADNTGTTECSTEIQAAIGLAQLPKLEGFTRRRIENATYLTRKLSKISGIKVPKVSSGVKHVYNQHTIQIEEDRDHVANVLRDSGIQTRVYYPEPLNKLSHLSKFKGKCPVAEEICKKVLSLPVHPRVTKSGLDKIIGILKEVV